MTKMEMIERFYGRNEELERKFEAAEKAGDAKPWMLARMPTRIFSRKSGLRGKPLGT